MTIRQNSTPSQRTTNGQPRFELPKLTTSQLVMATLIVALVALSFWLLLRFEQAVLILFAAIILSIAMRPAVDRLRRIGVPPAVSVLLVYGIALLVFGLLVWFGTPPVVEQASTIGQEARQIYTQVRQSMLDAPNVLLHRLAQSLPTTVSLGLPPQGPPAVTPDEGLAPEVSPLTIVSRTLRLLFLITAVFLLALFWTLESERFKRFALLLLPQNKREGARELIDDIETRVGKYMTAVLTLSAIQGGMALVAYLIIGLPYAVLFGLIYAVFEIIPVVGPWIASIPPLVVALTISPVTALWVVIAIILVNQIEANFMAPRVMHDTLGVRPVITIIAITGLGSLFGVLGAVVALPLVAVIQILLEHFVLESARAVEPAPVRDRIGVLRYETQQLIEDIRKRIRQREEEDNGGPDEEDRIEDSIEAIAVDLDSLLADYHNRTEDA